MTTRSFASVGYVAAIAGAALGCYLVSLRVASERAELEKIETQIVLAQRDIRLLQTEIGTRGRLAQLERWNVKVLALSAPKADQFLDGGYALAKLTAPPPRHEVEAPVVLASAPAPEPKKALEQRAVDEAGGADPAAVAAPAKLIHMASLKRPAEPGKPTARPAPGVPASELLQTASLTRARTAARPPASQAAVTPAKPASPRTATARDPLAPR